VCVQGAITTLQGAVGRDDVEQRGLLPLSGRLVDDDGRGDGDATILHVFPWRTRLTGSRRRPSGRPDPPPDET